MANQKSTQATTQAKQSAQKNNFKPMPAQEGQELEGLVQAPLQMQAAMLTDDRFQAENRQAAALQLNQEAGNRYVQRALEGRAGTASSAQQGVIQRGIWDSLTEWVRGWFSTDPQDVVRNLNTALTRANQVTTAASGTTSDAQMRRRLQSVSQRLGSLQRVTGGMVTALDTADKVSKVEELISALNDIPADISSDPARAADAFGRLFAAAGELGQELPQGPWTPYFVWLGNSRDFFTNMRAALDPSVRWRRQFEEIERESR